MTKIWDRVIMNGGKSAGKINQTDVTMSTVGYEYKTTIMYRLNGTMVC